MSGVGNKKETQYILMTVPELLEATGGALLYGDESISFSSVCIDSRLATHGSLFVALKGEMSDGHLYVDDAIKNGASVILMGSYILRADGYKEKFKSLSKEYGVAFVSVEEPLYALQKSAKFYLNKQNLKLKIGITGSSGKTTVKELIGAIFSKIDNTFVSFGNLNSDTGVPLSIFSVRPEHRIAVFEMGMNRKGEMAELTYMLTPDVAVITNIGLAHVGILRSIEEIAREKKKIFAYFTPNCIGFVPKCEFTQFLQDGVDGKMIVFSSEFLEGFEGAVDCGLEGSIIKYKGKEIALHLLGKHNIQNAICAISVAQYFGVSDEIIKTSIEGVGASFGRSQLMKGFATCFFDCYNANPDSMAEAINFCNMTEQNARHVYILGSMLELGEKSNIEHQRICEKVFDSNATLIFLFGTVMLQGFFDYLTHKNIDFNIANHSMEIGRKKVIFYKDGLFEDFSEDVKKNIKEGDFVLLKASRSLKFERLKDVILNKNRG